MAQSEFEARADKLDKGVGEVEGAEVKRRVNFETGGGGKKGLFGEEDKEGEEELRKKQRRLRKVEYEGDGECLYAEYGIPSGPTPESVLLSMMSLT